jgi:hypothetical protein
MATKKFQEREDCFSRRRRETVAGIRDFHFSD